MAAARGTTNFVMFDWFARRLGVDTSKIAVVNTATPGLIGYALADRADAVQLWEPAWTGLMARKPDIRTLDLAIEKNWKAFAGSNNIPYLGVAAHQDWIDKNRAVIPRLYQALCRRRRMGEGEPGRGREADGPARHGRLPRRHRRTHQEQ